MNRTLYWTHFDKYQQCPQQYLWSYGWEGIDLGHGVGERMPKPKRTSEHHLMMGTVTQGTLEDFYNNDMWHDRDGYRDRLLQRVRARFNLEAERRHIDWDVAPPREEMYQVCEDGVMGFVDHTMKAHKFLGPWAKSEYELRGWIKHQVEVACKVDFLIRGKDGRITILEGKNSKYKGKYVNKDQIRWAAMCYYLSYRLLPDRLAFVYWRFPYGSFAPGSTEPEQGVEWVPVVKAELQELALTALRVGWKMRDREFSPTPDPNVCRLCDYELICEARKVQKAQNVGRKKKADELGVEPGVFVDLDLSD